MSTLQFELSTEDPVMVEVTALFNAGFAGRDAAATRAHIEELEHLGIPAPTSVPAVYSLPPYLATQDSEIVVRSERTSGEVEAAVILLGPDPDDVLLTVASDHSDRELETHEIAAGKAAAPDVFAKQAWRLRDVSERLEKLQLRAWVGPRQSAAIQHGSLGDVLSVDHWLERLREQDLFVAGTLLLLGTIPMIPGVDQFQDHWRIELADPVANRLIACSYHVRLVRGLDAGATL